MKLKRREERTKTGVDDMTITPDARLARALCRARALAWNFLQPGGYLHAPSASAENRALRLA